METTDTIMIQEDVDMLRRVGACHITVDQSIGRSKRRAMQLREILLVRLLMVVRLERVDDAKNEESNGAAKSDCVVLV